MKKTFVAVLLAALMLAVVGVTMIMAASESDVTITKTAQTPNYGSQTVPGVVFPNDLITYTIVITANKVVSASLADVIPAHTVYVTHTVTPRLAGDDTAHGYGAPLTDTLSGSGNFPGGYIYYNPPGRTLGIGVVTMTLTVKVNAGVRAGTVITNAAHYDPYGSFQLPSSWSWSNVVSTTVGGRLYLPIIAK